MAKQVVDCPEVFALKNFKNLDGGVPINMAVKAKGTFLFTKQIPLDRDGKTVSPGGDILAQTRQTLENLKNMVLAAGATMKDVVAITWYVTDIEGYYGSNSSKLRREYLPEPHPTSVVIEVSKLASPEWKVELLATVVVPD